MELIFGKNYLLVVIALAIYRDESLKRDYYERRFIEMNRKARLLRTDESQSAITTNGYYIFTTIAITEYSPLDLQQERILKQV